MRFCFIFLHRMRFFLEKRWVLLLVLVVFIICKLPHLSYPFYWDESWPYAAALKAMYLHGPSLMPNAINPDLSRGHPLFFHAAAAIWMRIFGTGHIAMHSFALFIAVLTLILVYEAGLRLFKQRVAVISLLLIATQVVFFVQASFVLLEVLVALLVFASLYFYAQGRYLLAGVALTALFFTKESGLITGFVIGIDALISVFSKGGIKPKVWKLLTVAVPCVLIAVFFIVQKHLLGWYIFPLHNELIEHKMSAFWYNFKYNCVANTFHLYLRYWYYVALYVLMIIAAVKNKVSKQIWGVIIVITGIILCCTRYLGSKDYIIGGPILLAGFVAILYALKKKVVFENTRQQKLMLLISAFIFCFFCFSSAIFFTYRYLIEALVSLLFFTAVLFDLLLSKTYKALYYPALALILLVGFFSFKNDDRDGDCDPGAFTGMEMQQGVVDYLESQQAYDKVIGTGSFLNSEHLTDPSTGFLHSNRTFTKVAWLINNDVDYAVFNSNEFDPRYADIHKFTMLHLVYRFHKGKLWAEVYGK